MIKNENYIQICGWMINELNLKGTELLVYALIYGFSQDGKSIFNGSLNYISEWANCSRQGVINCLKSLLEKGLIEKQVIEENGVKRCEYKALKGIAEQSENELVSSQKSLPPQSKNLTRGSQKSLPPQSKNLTRGSQKSLPNNLLDNTNDNTTSTATDKEIEDAGENARFFNSEIRYSEAEDVFIQKIKELFGYNPGFEPDPFPELLQNFNSCSLAVENITDYISWIYDLLKKNCKNQANFTGYFYKSFTKEFHISTFAHQLELKKEQQKKKKLNQIVCPVCGFKHDKFDFYCPKCQSSCEVLEDEKMLKKEKASWILQNDNPKRYQEYKNTVEELWKRFPITVRFNNPVKQAEFEKAEKEINEVFLYSNPA